MLVARLFSKIYKKGGIILIDFMGKNLFVVNLTLINQLTLKILKKNLNWKLLINPDLSFPEAYMRWRYKN